MLISIAGFVAQVAQVLQAIEFIDVLEWLGALTGATGALLVALNIPISRWGWPCWIVSNGALMGLYAMLARWPLLMMQTVFMATALIGFYRWWICPPKPDAA